MQRVLRVWLKVPRPGGSRPEVVVATILNHVGITQS